MYWKKCKDLLYLLYLNEFKYQINDQIFFCIFLEVCQGSQTFWQHVYIDVYKGIYRYIQRYIQIHTQVYTGIYKYRQVCISTNRYIEVQTSLYRYTL